MTQRINFFEENVRVEIPNREDTKQWIIDTIEAEGKDIEELSFIFCNDQYLNNINVKYLDHDTYTDIITFDNSDHKDKLEGDIYISIDRVRENAKEFMVTYHEELYRVIIHGVLHLLGYDDKLAKDAEMMRKKENEYLDKRG